MKLFVKWSLREKYLFSEFSSPYFKTSFRLSTYSVQMRENKHQKNSEYGQFSQSAC